MSTIVKPPTPYMPRKQSLATNSSRSRRNGALNLDSQPPPYPIWRFSLADYQRLIEAGVLDGDDHVELWEGYLVPKMPHGPLHDFIVQKINKLFMKRLPVGWEVRVQSAVTTGDSQLEPDLAIVQESLEYAQRHPVAADTALVIEVADSSAERDQTEKPRLYATANFVEYWVVNVRENVVVVYRGPQASGDAAYSSAQSFHAGDAIELRLDESNIISVAVTDLLPNV